MVYLHYVVCLTLCGVFDIMWCILHYVVGLTLCGVFVIIMQCVSHDMEHVHWYIMWCVQ